MHVHSRCQPRQAVWRRCSASSNSNGRPTTGYPRRSSGHRRLAVHPTSPRRHLSGYRTRGRSGVQGVIGQARVEVHRVFPVLPRRADAGPGVRAAAAWPDGDGSAVEPGRQYAPGAPRWSAYLVANFERPIGNGLTLGLTGNVQYKSRTHLSADIPSITYPSYATIDASIRLGIQDRRWQLALIGKNLTDKLAVRGMCLRPGGIPRRTRGSWGICRAGRFGRGSMRWS